MLGPTAVRTKVTASSEPSNSGTLASPLTGNISATDRSATTRSRPSASRSARCTRTMPRFQFGSHCAVTVASAARITVINSVATSTSISVKPASPASARRGFALIRRPSAPAGRW